MIERWCLILSLQRPDWPHLFSLKSLQSCRLTESLSEFPLSAAMKFISLLMISAAFAATIDREDGDKLEELAEGMNPYGSLDEDEFLEQVSR